MKKSTTATINTLSTTSSSATAAMRKSNSFSFSQLAAAAATSSSSNANKNPAATASKLDFAKLTSQLKKDGGKKTSTDDSFRRWEELRAKKLEALNINAKTGRRKNVSNSEKRAKKEEQQQQQQQQQQQLAAAAAAAKYNHQESIQPPPLKPRNPQPTTTSTTTQTTSTHKSMSRHHHRDRMATAAAVTNTVTQRRPKFSLHPNWYTENIYTNQSMDDTDCESVTTTKRPLTTSASFSHYNARSSSSSNRRSQYRNSFPHYDFNGNNRTNNININISNMANTKMHGHHHSSFEYEDDGYDIDTQQQQQQYFERHRNYPKSHSCSFAERHRERTTMIDATRSRSVPKSHSFAGTNRTNLMRQYDMDVIEYQRYKRMMAAQRQHASSSSGQGAFCGASQQQQQQQQQYEQQHPYVMRICDREGCFSETCLVKNVNNSQNISINNNIINNNNINTSHIINEWDMRNKNSNYHDRNDPRRNLPPRETFLDDVETFDDDDFIFNDGFSFQEFPCQPPRQNPRQPRPHRNPYFSSMCCAPSAHFPDEFHRRRRIYDRDLDDLFRHERSKVLIRNKFDKLNKYSDEFTDDYQKSFEDLFHENKTSLHGHNLKQSKAMLEVKPPNKYDDTESDSTDLDLDDFNLDFEKYWEELEDKNLSTSSTLELADELYDNNNNHVDSKSTDQEIDHSNNESDANNNPIHFINDFYKPTKYSPLNSKRLDYFQKILPPKKINIASTVRPLGLVTANDQQIECSTAASMKRPLTLSNIIESPLHNDTSYTSYNPYDESMDHAKFEIIPKKTGLKISRLYNFQYDNCHHNNLINNNCKLKSTARPLIFW